MVSRWGGDWKGGEEGGGEGRGERRGERREEDWGLGRGLGRRDRGKRKRKREEDRREYEYEGKTQLSFYHTVQRCEHRRIVVLPQLEQRTKGTYPSHPLTDNPETPPARHNHY